MTASRAEKIETAIGLGSSGALACALSFAGYRASAGITTATATIAVSAISAVIGLVAGHWLLRLAGGASKPFPQAVFEVLAIEPVEGAAVEELVLTEADRFLPEAAEEPLILDDVLAGVSPDSRVVRLFDPAAMPTPGQLKARIDRHIGGGTSHSPSPDASEALFEALADLRRSLR